MISKQISFVFDLQRFADTKFNIATGNTVLSSDNLTIDASKVTSGTLAIARGGTGQTVNPSMLTNLATTAAANVFAASPRPGVTGTLGVGNGGTGLTASPSMLTNLSSTTAANVFQASPRPGITGTLGIVNGGTGATTAAVAFQNIKVGHTCIQYQGETVTNPWHKVASFNMGGTWADSTLILAVKNCTRNTGSGILVVHIMSNSSAPDAGGIYWLVQHNMDPNAFLLQAPAAVGGEYALWCHVPGANSGARFTVLDCSNVRNGKALGWTLYDNNHGGTQAQAPTEGKITVSTLGGTIATASNVSGIVAIANGGTGQTTAALARNALGLGNTTGALPVANGGTGQTVLSSVTVGKANTLTTARALQVSLANTNSVTFNGTADVKTIGVQGVLPVANGGTGQTTAAAARNALGLGNTTGALPVANGGTGQTVLSAVNVGGATKATQDGSGNVITSYYTPLLVTPTIAGGSGTGETICNIPSACTNDVNAAINLNMANFNSVKSGMYTCQVSVGASDAASSKPWFNVLNVKHRNGQSDGRNYGMIFYSLMQSDSDLYWRHQFSGAWKTERKIIDSVNVSLQTAGNVVQKYSRSNAGGLDWGTNNGYLIDKSALAYWNGTYNGTTSNLSNCKQGAFGSIVTCNSPLPIANGGTGATVLSAITVGKANTLTTARALQVSLSSTGAPTFNGTADVKTIGVTGTLAIGNGGTGITSNPSMLTNLGTTTAANVFQASPRPGVTGTLPVANGGTGQTNLTNVAVGSAAKFTSAQTINLTGDVTGSVSSAAGWTINTLRRSCVVGTNNKANSKPWYKVCSASFTGGSQDKILTMLVHHQSSFFLFGILRLYVRRETSSWNANCSLQWMLNYGFTLSDFVLVLSTDLTTAELWVNIPSTAQRCQFIVLSESDNSNLTQFWTFYPAISAGQKASIDTAGTQKVSTMCSSSIRNQQLPSYCVCSTAAATAAKTATCDNFHDLRAGIHVTVKFTVTNTASNPTLNINSTGAKAIYYRGQPIVPEAIQANTTIEFVYNGSQYDVIGSLVWTTANP